MKGMKGMRVQAIGMAIGLGLAMAGSALSAPEPAAADPAFGRVVVRDHARFYRIRGEDADTLRAQMKALGPTREGSDQRFAAMTLWRIDWSGRYRVDRGRCRLADVEVRADLTLTLPRWSPRRGTPAALREDWRQFMDKLQLHEQGHRQIALAAAEKVRAALARIPEQPDCDALDRQVGQTGQAILVAAAAEDDAYDRDTGNGAKQGVKL